jgi:diaminohydroxyphosphoribosylaminopyrimidine deaminase / 5-amino-6-(5-phosphoribosylamino)uracil reductase
MSVPVRAAAAALPDEAEDRRFMAAALSLGRRNLGQTFPNPAVGALVVRQEEGGPVIVGRGFTARGGRPHAETEALKAAGEFARGATMYVTLEPCAHLSKTPPCADAIVKSGIARCVVALEDPNPEVMGKGMERMQTAGISVVAGIGADDARVVHAGHIRRIVSGRPHIILKLAVSADGKTGAAGRKPARISCEASMNEAHMLRATSDAILVGSGTVIADDPQLNCRLPGMSDRSPVRVVLDGKLQTPLDSKLVQTAKEIPLWLVTCKEAPAEAEKKLKAAGAVVIRVPSLNGRLDLQAAFLALGHCGITRALVEGGPMLSTALVQHDLVDEAIIVRSSKVLGPDAINALEGLPLEALSDSPKLKIIERRMAGVDSLMHLFRSA